MNHLYHSLAAIYDSMYQTFIPYDEEYHCYRTILDRHQAIHVLEIACGAGHLASRFVRDGYPYIGMDLSVEMLTLAQQRCPEARFVQADMRDFVLDRPVSAAIIPGRSLSYLISNEDVLRAFTAIRRALEPNGVLVFDVIDASRFMLTLTGEPVRHEAAVDNIPYYRDSRWKLNPAQSWLFDWHSTYYRRDAGGDVWLGEDESTIRAFTRDDVELMLRLTGFSIVDVTDRPSYAFDTCVFTAQAPA